MALIDRPRPAADTRLSSLVRDEPRWYEWEGKLPDVLMGAAFAPFILGVVGVAVAGGVSIKSELAMQDAIVAAAAQAVPGGQVQAALDFGAREGSYNTHVITQAGPDGGVDVVAVASLTAGSENMRILEGDGRTVDVCPVAPAEWESVMRDLRPVDGSVSLLCRDGEWSAEQYTPAQVSRKIVVPGAAATRVVTRAPGLHP